jgi:uncharacterized protein YyaL (SSP411 family)
VAALALGRLAALTGEERYARAALRTLELFFPLMRSHPGGCGTLAQALDESLAPVSVLVLRGAPGALADASKQFAREFLPGTLVLAIPDGAAGLPLPLDKPRRPGPVTGWLCRGPACLEPSNDLEALKRACRARDSV